MGRHLLIAAGLFVAASCGGAPPEAPKTDVAPAGVTIRHLNPELAWHGDNRAALDAMLDAEGRGSPTYDRKNRPVATFDFDNTVVRNDVGFATFAYMLTHDKLLQPPEKDWSKTSRWLTKDAREALTAACGALAEPGAPLPTSTNPPCADELLSLYHTGKTKAGVAAFEGASLRKLEPSFAWGAAVQAGHTPQELRDYANAALDQYLGNPIGSTETIGTIDGLDGYLRIYEPMKDLIGALQDNGFDVWIVSASPQPIVEVAAARVGVDASHVIGVRLLQAPDGRYRYGLAGCGNVGDGEDGVMTYMDGKRCWINKVIFHDDSAAALVKKGDPKSRPTFAAGDSDTDVTFLRDATYRLTINRNGGELMCHTYARRGDRWLVNPMFLEPLPKRAQPYDCAAACRNDQGNAGPCMDDSGAPIPNQEDVVFGTP